jgi:vancomycin resistance protein VanJ
MKQSILAGVLLVAAGAVPACYSTPCKPPVPLRKQAHQLKVVTFNVNYAGVNMAHSARVLQQSGADVVALQETTPAWERYLRRRLRRQYPVQRFRHHGGAGGLAFLSRYPLRSVRLIKPPRRGWFPAWLVEARTALGRVHFLNVHLRPPIGDSGRTSSVPAAYFCTRSIRKREIQKHLSQTPRGRPLVVLGDFNESGGPALRWVRGRGLRSALARFDSSTPTWRWKTSVMTFRSRLDHLFFSKHLRCVGAQVLGYAASDHYPVEAVFAAAPKAAPDP